jgi:hypothetical protein
MTSEIRDCSSVSQLVFWSYISPPPSGSKVRYGRNPHEAVTFNPEDGWNHPEVRCLYSLCYMMQGVQ